MALGLAMHLSGLESEYFYDIGARTIYDAGAEFMATNSVNTVNKPTSLQNIRSYPVQPKRKHTNRHTPPKHIKARPREIQRCISPFTSTTDTTTDDECTTYAEKSFSKLYISESQTSSQAQDAVNNLLTIIQESDETDCDAMTDSSSSSGTYMGIPRKNGKRNKLLTAIMTKQEQAALEAYRRMMLANQRYATLQPQNFFPPTNAVPAVQYNRPVPQAAIQPQNFLPPTNTAPAVRYNLPAPPAAIHSSAMAWQQPLPYINISLPPPSLENSAHISPIGTKPNGSPVRRQSPQVMPWNPPTAQMASFGQRTANSFLTANALLPDVSPTVEEGSASVQEAASLSQAESFQPTVHLQQERSAGPSGSSSSSSGNDSKKDEKADEVKVMYQGRDLLDLGANLRQDPAWSWPVVNPGPSLDPTRFSERGAQNQPDIPNLSYIWENCNKCDFRFPTDKK